jgi:hypothetical protein
MVSIVVCEEMAPNQAIEVHGVKRFSEYYGYSDKLGFAGESEGEKRIDFVAIDALHFGPGKFLIPVDDQYQP